MKTMVVTALLVVLAASVTQAVPWFSDNFESYAVPLRLRLATPNWEGGTGPENYINAAPTYPNCSTGQAVRLKGSSGTGVTSDASTTGDLSALAAGSLQLFSFTLQSEIDHQEPGYNHAYIQWFSSTGADMGYWYGNSGAITPRVVGSVGPAVSILDGAVHTFGVRYDPATGLTEWLHNGGVQWSQTIATGLAVKEAYVKDVHRTHDDDGHAINDWIYLDNVVVSPEPAGLVLLGLSSLLLRRRR